MKAGRIRSSGGKASLALAVCWLAAAGPGFGEEQDGSLRPVVTTNYLVVTNIILVTNYVSVTNGTLTSKEPALAGKSSKLPPLSWVPPPDSFDWVQLKSGEWLKGRIKAMQDRKLEFDSEEIDSQTFDWKDIRQMRSGRIIDVLFIDGELLSGPVTVTPEKILVSGEEPRVLPREQLQSLTPGGSKERNYWSGNMTLGLTLRSGNTEQVEYNAQARLQRRTPATRLSLDYLGNVSTVDSVESANNHRVNAEFDLWLSRRLYLLVPFTEYYKDPFQNLAHRITIGTGVGYDLIDRSHLEWNVTAGPAYQLAWFDSVQPGEDPRNGTAALVFGSRFDWDITKRVEWILEYRGQYTSREVGETTHHFVSTLSLEMSKHFDLDVSFIWDRITNPKVGSDGLQPKPDDFRLVVGLSVDF